jgi:hypothetical protein
LSVPVKGAKSSGRSRSVSVGTGVSRNGDNEIRIFQITLFKDIKTS